MNVRTNGPMGANLVRENRPTTPTQANPKQTTVPATPASHSVQPVTVDVTANPQPFATTHSLQTPPAQAKHVRSTKAAPVRSHPKALNAEYQTAKKLAEAEKFAGQGRPVSAARALDDAQRAAGSDNKTVVEAAAHIIDRSVSGCLDAIFGTARDFASHGQAREMGMELFAAEQTLSEISAALSDAATPFATTTRERLEQAFERVEVEIERLGYSQGVDTCLVAASALPALENRRARRELLDDAAEFAKRIGRDISKELAAFA